ncbi:hypothetical protein BC827DRAFT_1272055 [Russula dissimulans]|nr:hypothetical protein BC827DRAFT_1272055 [Russula dissimulans]
MPLQSNVILNSVQDHAQELDLSVVPFGRELWAGFSPALFRGLRFFQALGAGPILTSFGGTRWSKYLLLQASDAAHMSHGPPSRRDNVRVDCFRPLREPRGFKYNREQDLFERSGGGMFGKYRAIAVVSLGAVSAGRLYGTFVMVALRAVSYGPSFKLVKMQSSIRNTLNELPSTLDKTYQAFFERKGSMSNAFNFAAAIRPLYVEQLTGIFTIKFDPPR